MKNIPDEKFDEIIKRLKSLEQLLSLNQKQPKEKFLTNKDFMLLMDISKRTAQYWRSKGIIGYAEIGTKVYYKMKDIEALIAKNYRKEEL